MRHCLPLFGVGLLCYVAAVIAAMWAEQQQRDTWAFDAIALLAGCGAAAILVWCLSDPHPYPSCR